MRYNGSTATQALQEQGSRGWMCLGPIPNCVFLSQGQGILLFEIQTNMVSSILI